MIFFVLSQIPVLALCFFLISVLSKPGAALQSPVLFTYSLIQYVTIFIPWLYGAAKLKWLEMVFPVIK